MEIIEIIQVCGVLILGGIIQSSAGFGFGLFAIPILLFFGFDLPASVSIVVIGSGIQKIKAVHFLREELDWKEMRPYMIAGLAALAPGVYAMMKISAMDQDIVKQVIGGLVLAMLLLRLKGAMKQREKVAKIWAYIAGLFSGFLNGFANIGGPPLVLWILAHKWPNRKTRGTALACALIFVPFQIPLMIFLLGNSVLNPMLKTVLLSPAVLLGTWLGLKLGEKISKQHLEIYMQVLLYCIALVSLVRPLFH